MSTTCAQDEPVRAGVGAGSHDRRRQTGRALASFPMTSARAVSGCARAWGPCPSRSRSPRGQPGGSRAGCATPRACAWRAAYGAFGLCFYSCLYRYRFLGACASAGLHRTQRSSVHGGDCRRAVVDRNLSETRATFRTHPGCGDRGLSPHPGRNDRTLSLCAGPMTGSCRCSPVASTGPCRSRVDLVRLLARSEVGRCGAQTRSARDACNRLRSPACRQTWMDGRAALSTRPRRPRCTGYEAAQDRRFPRENPVCTYGIPRARRTV